mmetsp:Transcript_24947/g.61373  ORF Transcript_24947/g.61373 Transcript_24947/m.61373 type:complete len:192 (-) Transcript_24947:395-970(-)|eukprot:CAMPEP_0113605896 /NCGR_PEP_ID=MMETSP0017_2-20120614/2572_1 /TAXON_ID=2856 /ORGANISM="Cylindrotheca closterium" /LENGTH=191 /DNA_ID=CAMNT_0000514417 /DNA_START=162 /DNA_END=737 /DNA_ORIENTATION=+ /assembly_acc=CAM_ASM_000147
MWKRIFLSTFVLSNGIWVSNAFLPVPVNSDNALKSPQRTETGSIGSTLLMTNNNNNDEDDESTSQESSSQANYLDDLTPPPINLKRESILFSPNPSTKGDNEVLDLWITCKERLPAVITGAWPWRPTQVADADPMGALYNIAFVRMPVIGVGIGYIQQALIQGHPLMVDVGQGPFEISPLIVLSVLAFVLA